MDRSKQHKGSEGESSEGESGEGYKLFAAKTGTFDQHMTSFYMSCHSLPIGLG